MSYTPVQMNRYPIATLTDAHIHLFEHGYAGTGEGDDDLVAYERLRAAHGIDQALVVCFEGDERFAGNNAYVAGVASRTPWVRPLAYVPVSDEGRTALSQISDPFVGVTLYLLDQSTADTAATWLATSWASLRTRQGLVSLNVRAAFLGQATAVAQAAGVPVLLSHLGLPGSVDPHTPAQAPETVLAPLLAAAEVPNLHVKVSGLYALGPAATDLAWQQRAVALTVEAYGPDRLHWGSDFPPVLAHTTFQAAQADDVLDSLSPAAAARVRGAALADLLDRASGGRP